MHPNDIDTRWDLARCYARQKDYQQAIKAYENVLQDRPEFHDARKELIVCLAALQQWDAAETEARYLKGFTLDASRCPACSGMPAIATLSTPRTRP